MKVLITGSAGFIGSQLALRLLDRGDEVIGIDNLNDYYDVSLKEARLARISSHDNFTEARISIEDRPAMEALFAEHKPDRVVNLAAQAGVRYSLENPHSYVESNIVGFMNILEGCRHNGVEHLVYASSSSVYGANTNMPFSIHNNVDHPLSMYAATKKANELMAHTYSHLYSLPTTGLRFFTVYGPWGRPDMAAFIFIRKILAGEPIPVFNNGNMRRDFTYIDDIVAGVLACLDKPPVAQEGSAPNRVYNLGNNNAEPLMRFISVLEDALGQKAEIDFQPLQTGDVPETSADISETQRDFGFEPKTTIDEGLPRLVAWYREYYGA